MKTSCIPRVFNLKFYLTQKIHPVTKETEMRHFWEYLGSVDLPTTNFRVKKNVKCNWRALYDSALLDVAKDLVESQALNTGDKQYM